MQGNGKNGRSTGTLEKLGNTRENEDMQRKIKVLFLCHGRIWGRDDKCRI